MLLNLPAKQKGYEDGVKEEAKVEVLHQGRTEVRSTLLVNTLLMEHC